MDFKLLTEKMQNICTKNNEPIKVTFRRKRTIKQKIKNKTVELLAASTSHGLPSFFRSKRLILKVMWLSLFIISTSFGIYTVFETIQNFLKYEVVTKIDVITEVPTECKLFLFLI